MKKSIIAFLLSLVVSSTAMGSDLLYVANNNNETLSVLDAATFVPIAGSPFMVNFPFMAGGINQVVVNSSGTRIYITNNFNVNNISVLDGTTFMPIAGSPFPSGGVGPIDIALNPAETQLYVVNSGSNDVSVLDATSPTLPFLGLAPVGMSPEAIVLNPLGTFAYVVDQNSLSVSVFNQTFPFTAHPMSPIAVPTPRGIAIDPTGTILYVIDGNGFIYSFNASTLAPILGPLPTGFPSSGAAAVNPDPLKPFLYVLIGGGVDSVGVFNTTTLLPVGASPYLTGGMQPVSLVLDPTGTLLYIANQASNSISVLDAVTLSPVGGSPHTNGLGPGILGLALGASPISAPQTLQGTQKKNDFGLAFELFNLLKWDASSTPVAGYFVYRDGIQIATLDNSTFQYEDHDRQPGIATTYSITAFDANGLESNQISAVVR